MDALENNVKDVNAQLLALDTSTRDETVVIDTNKKNIDALELQAKALPV